MAENNFLFAGENQEQLLSQGYVLQSDGGLQMGGVIQQNPQNNFNGVAVNQVRLKRSCISFFQNYFDSSLLAKYIRSVFSLL